MHLSNNVKVLVFDAYGTLFDVYSLGNRLQYHFPEKASQINPIWREKQLQYTWLRSMMDQYMPFSQITEDALVYACKATNTPLSTEIHADLMEHYFSLDAFEEVKPALEELSQTYQTAILSNANRQMLEKAVTHNNIGECLNTILSVDDIKFYKPLPQVYQMAVDHFKLKREEIAFVSSNTWDVAGAKSFGFSVIWLNRGSGQLDELGLTPNLIISNLKDLLE